MITQVTTIKLFYPMFFATIAIIAVCLIFTVKSILEKYKEIDSKNFLYKTHTNEHIDTTDKFSKAHTEIVTVKWDEAHEKEMHRMEIMIKEINNKVDMLVDRVIKLELNN